MGSSFERNDFYIRASVIIPVYNQEEYIANCVERLMKEQVLLEVLLIDDGSEDRSLEICESLASKYPNVRCFHQENSGVSSARNVGIREASGKYICYLDADDTLEPNTFTNVVDCFDTMYDQVDMVTYPIKTIYQERILEPHFRYQYLKESGVYDLNKEPYIGQTTMNIVVKNQFKENHYFNIEQTYSEDQSYCCTVLEDKLKMGYCKEGAYLYNRRDDSSSGNLAGACYIFEQCMGFFEALFQKYEVVPVAFQGLFLNDLYWKMNANILFPYHYNREEYDVAIERIKVLLYKCDDRLIIQHPNFDYYEKFYLAKMKDNHIYSCLATEDGFGLNRGAELLSYESSMELVITKVIAKDSGITIQGFLKSVYCMFYDNKPTLCVMENENSVTRKLTLEESSHNYYLSHEKTQRFWAMEYIIPYSSEVKDFCFRVELGGYWYPVHYYFMPLVPFSYKVKKRCWAEQGIELAIDSENKFHLKSIERKVKPEIWLYYDCKTVSRDNGLIQYEYDIVKKDGIQRYYICTNEIQWKWKNEKTRFVKFGSLKHKQLLKQARKVLTAYIEEENIFPKIPNTINGRYNYNFETVYLQHGVLHIDMPWKYAKGKLMADKIVVSTVAEKALYIKNGFKDKDLIEAGMPRLDMVKSDSVLQKKKGPMKLLYVPSWRFYLTVYRHLKGWVVNEQKLVRSTYYRGMQELITNSELNQILEKRDCELVVKFHPILQDVRHLFYSDQERITFAMNPIVESEYSLVITDFSSYIYDFLYLGIPVLYYIPDIHEFRCGMNGYRNFYPYDSRVKVSTSVGQAVGEIEKALSVLDNQEKMSIFFQCESTREAIYQSNIK